VRSRGRALVRSSPPPQMFQNPEQVTATGQGGWSTAWDSAWDWIQLQGHNNINRHEWSMAGIALFYLHPWDKIFSMFFCLRNKEPADLERAISMIMQLTSGFTYDVKDVKETPRHTGPANHTQFMINIGAFEWLYQKIFLGITRPGRKTASTHASQSGTYGV